MEKTKVVVTGGAGFIGSHLCEKLYQLGNDVVSVDNYFTGSVDNHVEGVTYVNGDAAELIELVDTAEYVFHLGEYSRVEQSFDDIDYVWENNKNGIYGVLKFCKLHNAKLIYAGSSTKYADDGQGPHQSPYAWTKASNTDFVQAYAEWFNLKYAITYFYNVYGPREISSGKYATLIAKFTKQAMNGEPLTIVSPGTQKRNFTHISDIVDGLIKVGNFGTGDGYGIGNPSAYSVNEVATMFSDKTEMLPMRKGNRMSAPVVTNKVQSLGWQAKVSLVDYVNSLTMAD